MKFLHETNVTHVSMATVRAIRLARKEHDDVQFSFNNVPVVVNENSVPKEVTPRYDKARVRGDYRLIDARKGTRNAVFKVAVASIAAMFLAV